MRISILISIYTLTSMSSTGSILSNTDLSDFSTVGTCDIFVYQMRKWGGEGGGLNAFYWYQIFTLDSAVVEVQEMFSSHGILLTNAMYHHGETL